MTSQSKATEINNHELPQRAAPDPALARLDVLTGTWNIEGETIEGSLGPAGKVSSVQTFEWLEGGHCLVHRWEICFGSPSEGWDTSAVGEVDKGIQLWWYDAEAEKYRTQFFNTLGGPAGYEGEERDGILTFSGPARHRLIPNDDGTIAWDWELLDDVGSWMPWMHLRMTRAA